MASSAGSDAKISGAKIDPLESETKEGVPHAESSGGVVGSDRNIDQARDAPLGGSGQYQNPAPHADSQGVVGRDADIDKAKIDPLVAQAESESAKPDTGLLDERVDAARVEPMGEVREELK